MTNNAKIFEKGNIVTATKLSVLTIGIGKVSDLKEVPGTIRHENGKVVIVTKEQPDGCVYDQDRTVVVRVIGGKVLMDGFYDIYAPGSEKVEKLLRNEIPLDILRNTGMITEENYKDLLPILKAGSDIKPAMAPAEVGRKVIVITDEMITEGITECYNEWEPETATKLCSGDVFVVTDENQMTGYRIGKDEFAGTHTFGLG